MQSNTLLRSSWIVVTNDACRMAVVGVLASVLVVGACAGPDSDEEPALEMSTHDDRSAQAEEPAEDPFARDRARMVRTQLRARDIRDHRVLDAMGRVPRHQFVGPAWRDVAYADEPQPLEHGQTISQPYIVALMTQLAQPKPTDKALDVGTGSGYQAAVLSELCDKVYSIEIVESLSRSARARLERLGYDNVEVRHGDGYGGWLQHAPFDLIILAAAPDHVPQPLVDQLAPTGRLVLPVGDWSQMLMVIEKQKDGGTRTMRIAPVAFVPMTGQAKRRADK